MTITVTPTFFDTLEDNIAKSGPDLGLSIAAGSSSPLSAPLLRMSIPENTPIPSSLITVLDAAYLLHLLARDPQKVVAPGKSLISVLAGLDQVVTRTLDSPSEKSFRKTIHQAFWDQVSNHSHALTSCLKLRFIRPSKRFLPIYHPHKLLVSRVCTKTFMRPWRLYFRQNTRLSSLFPFLFHPLPLHL